MAATTPDLRPAVEFSDLGFPAYFQIWLEPVAVGAGHPNRWLAIFTREWLRGETTYTFPDLSGAPGFATEWGPAFGESHLVSVESVFTISVQGTLSPGSSAPRPTRVGYSRRHLTLEAR